jgi:hypothetical protein
MKHWIAVSLLLVGLLVCGCDSINQSQIQIVPQRTLGATAVATVPASERDAVKKILAEIATKHHFDDLTAISLHPDIICDYSQAVTTQPPSKNPVRLAAWTKGDRIVIDLFQKSIEGGEPIAYQKLRDEITSALQAQFGKRVVKVQKTQQATARTVSSP